MSDELLYEVRDQIGLITFNRPERMNTITMGMLNDLSARLLEADADPGVRAIVITGAGRAWCAGLDVGAAASGQGIGGDVARLPPGELDLRTALRDDALDGEKVDEEIRRRLHAVVADKLPGHGINDPSFIQPARPMSAIGG